MLEAIALSQIGIDKNYPSAANLGFYKLMRPKPHLRSTWDFSHLICIQVYPDGRSMLMMEGNARLALAPPTFTRVQPFPASGSPPLAVTIDLGHISIVFNAGHRLRLSIATASSPKLWANPNDGTTFPDSVGVNTTVTLHLGLGTYLEADTLPISPDYGAL